MNATFDVVDVLVERLNDAGLSLVFLGNNRRRFDDGVKSLIRDRIAESRRNYPTLALISTSFVASLNGQEGTLEFFAHMERKEFSGCFYGWDGYHLDITVTA